MLVKFIARKVECMNNCQFSNVIEFDTLARILKSENVSIENIKSALLAGIDVVLPEQNIEIRHN